MNRHVKGHTSAPLSPNLPPKVAHLNPIPNIVGPTENDQFLCDIKHQEIKDMLSSQVGFRVTQMTPANATLCGEVREFFQDELPWGTD